MERRGAAERQTTTTRWLLNSPSPWVHFNPLSPVKCPTATRAGWTRDIDAAFFQTTSVTTRTLSGRLKYSNATAATTRRTVTRFFGDADPGAPTTRTLFRSVMSKRIVSHCYFRFFKKNIKPRMSKNAPNNDIAVAYSAFELLWKSLLSEMWEKSI